MKLLLTSGLLRKILLAMLIASLLPLALMTNFTLRNYQITKENAVKQSREDLTQKAYENLKSRVLTVAEKVVDFLDDREADLKLLAALSRTPETFLEFGRKTNRLWVVTQDGPRTFDFPLYREVAFIDNNGQEVIKVINDCSNYPFTCQPRLAKPSELVNVSQPENTLFKSETYFAEAITQTSEVYVGRPIGFYVPYQDAYASAQNRDGQRYRGMLRWAKPVFEGEKKVGLVVVSLELIHLLELTAHIAPANPESQAEIDPREADFAYLIDPQGWTISHPRHFNIAGVDKNGQWVTSINEKDRDDPGNLYRPGNLTQMGFIAPEFPKLVTMNERGETKSGGVLPLMWGGKDGRERVWAYASIPYYSGNYHASGFGLAIMSTDGERFYLESELLSTQIDNQITIVTERIKWVGVGTILLGAMLAFLLANGVARPVLRLTTAAQYIEAEDWTNVELDKLVGGRDEIGQLTRVFVSMANQVHARVDNLKAEVVQLKSLLIVEDSKRQEEVDEITNSESFKRITERAEQMKQRRRQGSRAMVVGDHELPPQSPDSNSVSPSPTPDL